MRKQLLASIRILLTFTVLVGVIYPLAITAISRLSFSDKSNGSFIKVDSKIVGSSLIGQNFEGSEWFHSRPSAAGEGYDAMASSGSNLGPTNEDFIASVEQRANDYRKENMLDDSVQVPLDAVTASGSGLDPEISLVNAKLQALRVAKARNLTESVVLQLISKEKTDNIFDFGMDERINVLKLNIALNKLSK